MAEKLKLNETGDQEKLSDNLEAERRAQLDRLKENAEKEAKAAEKPTDLTEIQRTIEEEALSGQQTAIDKAPTEAEQPSLGMQQQLKNDAYKRTMNKIRNDLNPVERRFSKVIHNPVIETISEASGKTIARPSAIIGGGLLSLVGSSAVLYMSKHYGFSYNTFTFFGLFAIGFLAGILIEFGLKLVRRKQS